ncbi:ATP-binding protein [Chlorobaculum thiosulfatiphilum]|uniref:ATP-binding protein n=1 Tax=Chlorobaculum thiosulfatiphilum TaxID=115852 RepID=A0A5C4S6U3_CHLTI|nr:ATP-binding protein [Chlorobaculum thiosulfatiphilum]TNJ39035.1 ATP-binding protein [Chlorobaculum thiosulfatiphilum]
MATAEQIKSLIRSHFNEKPEQFFTIALQVAAHEAKQGHQSLAHEIRTLVDKAKLRPGRVIPFTPDLDHLVLTTDPKERLGSLVQSDDMRGRIERILREYRQKDKLEKYGLSHRRKILLAGPPGTGKTLTASVLAGELGLPLFTIMMDKIVTKFMGETSAKLRQIFDVMLESRGVYFFDEFDAIGGERSRENDVGEMRRVLNAFLQFIERDESDSLIVAATNNPRILDQALFRRFDDVLHYHLPEKAEIERLIDNRLCSFRPKSMATDAAVKIAESLSHAEITQACDNAIKETILADRKIVTATLLKQMLQERRSAYKGSLEKE